MHDLGVTRGTRAQQLHRAWPGACTQPRVGEHGQLALQTKCLGEGGKKKKKDSFKPRNSLRAFLFLKHRLYFVHFRFFCFAGHGHTTAAFPPLCLEWERQPIGCPTLWASLGSSAPLPNQQLDSDRALSKMCSLSRS